MVTPRVSSRRIFPLICLVAAGCYACSSDAGSPTSGSGGQASAAGSTAIAGSAGTAALGGSAAQGGSSSTAAGTGGASGSASAGSASDAGSTSGGGGAGGSTAQGGSGGSSAGTGGAGGSGGSLPMLEPCAQPSVSHLKVWEMQVVGGSQVPANGSPLRKLDGGGYEMYVEWTLNGGDAYGTANAPLNNMGQYANGADPLKNAVDISKGDGLTIEYASTGGTYLQLRTAAVPHGGDHFRADLPSTNGQLQTIQLKYDTFRRPGGNTPPGNDILSGMFSFTFVGSATTKLTLRQVLIPGFVPPCG